MTRLDKINQLIDVMEELAKYQKTSVSPREEIIEDMKEESYESLDRHTRNLKTLLNVYKIKSLNHS